MTDNPIIDLPKMYARIADNRSPALLITASRPAILPALEDLVQALAAPASFRTQIFLADQDHSAAQRALRSARSEGTVVVVLTCDQDPLLSDLAHLAGEILHF